MEHNVNGREGNAIWQVTIKYINLVVALFYRTVVAYHFILFCTHLNHSKIGKIHFNNMHALT